MFCVIFKIFYNGNYITFQNIAEIKQDRCNK